MPYNTPDSNTQAQAEATLQRMLETPIPRPIRPQPIRGTLHDMGKEKQSAGDERDQVNGGQGIPERPKPDTAKERNTALRRGAKEEDEWVDVDEEMEDEWCVVADD